MAVSLMHQWHDSSVVEWCSTPSPFDMICALYELLWLLRLVCGGVWMHPRFVICFEGYIMITYIGLVTDGVCNTRLSHYLGVATPTLEASPHVTFGIPRSPLRIHYIWFDLVWARSGLLFLKLTSCSCLLIHISLYIISLLNYLAIVICYLYICSLSSRSSAAFSFPRGRY